jgi:uncharacterized protein
MFNWFRRQAPAAPSQPPSDGASFFSTHLVMREPMVRVADLIRRVLQTQPVAVGAQDDSSSGTTLKMPGAQWSGIPEVLAMWYASQGFIGYQLAAIISQHWLIAKACGMPGRDAIRNWFDPVSVDGDPLPPDAVKLMNRADRRFRLRWNLEQFIRMGRIFGVRVAIFRVESSDPEFYEKPFNLDGVTEGSYRGIVQVDPYWMAPELNQVATSCPDSPNFYEPTWWTINGKRYHRSHLVIYRNDDLPDILKPSYLYGGVPVPQKIMERVYASERTANEAPQLALTKRTTVWKTDMTAFAAKGDEAVRKLQEWVAWRDNYGVKLGDMEGDEFQQFDTSLADLDAVIMTQYQLVAAASDVPATKLMGTSPKGFGASGEYEEASYHEFLESIQSHDLTPFVERHHALVMRSEIAPRLGIQPIETVVEWRPLDSQTAAEMATMNLTKAQTGQALVASGAIDGTDERRRVAMDPTSGYHGIGATPEPEDAEEEEDSEAPALPHPGDGNA